MSFLAFMPDEREVEAAAERQGIGGHAHVPVAHLVAVLGGKQRVAKRRAWTLLHPAPRPLPLPVAFEPERLLVLDRPVRLLAAIALTFAPVFLANLIFAERFRESVSSTIAFGANLLGAMVGGLLEYGSLVIGYRALIPIVAILYAAAFLSTPRLAPRSAGAT